MASGTLWLPSRSGAGFFAEALKVYPDWAVSLTNVSGLCGGGNGAAGGVPEPVLCSSGGGGAFSPPGPGSGAHPVD